MIRSAPKTPLQRQIVQRMAALGLNAKELSDRAGLNQTAVSEILRGKSRHPRQNTLQALADVLGCTVSDLLEQRRGIGVPVAGARPAGPGIGAAAGSGAPDYVVEVAGDEYTALPVYDVRAAAGAGALVEGEEVLFRVMFRTQWLRSMTNAPPSQLAVIQIDGDSMWETLHHGDHVLVDRTQNKAARDGIYAIDMGDGIQVKRISIHPATGLLTVGSDNPRYPTYSEIKPSDIRFVGRAIWLGRQV